MVEHVGDIIYKLDLLPNYTIHLVFHVSILKKRVGSPNLVVDELLNGVETKKGATISAWN